MTARKLSRLDSLLQIGLTTGASHEQIDEAFELASEAWQPERFPAGTTARADAQAELEAIKSAYRRLRPLASSRNASAEPVSKTQGSEAAVIECPACNGRLRPRQPVAVGARVRCPNLECLTIFSIGEAGPILKREERNVQPDLFNDQPFARADREVFFEVEGEPADLPADYSIVSGSVDGDASLSDEADLALRQHIEDSGVVAFRVYRVGADGSEAPSWASALSTDEARSIAAAYGQGVFYLVKRGGLAIVTTGTPRAVLSLGRDRIRSRHGVLDA